MRVRLFGDVRQSSLFLSGLLVAGLAVNSVLGQTSTLRSRRDFSVGDHPVGVLALDYDGDGFLDLVTVDQQTNGTGDIALVKGFGDGTFRKVISLTSGLLPSSMVLADVNNDGRQDLVLANLRSQEVTVHLGQPGGFGSKISTPVVGTPNGVVAGDWNGDAVQDVAVLNGAQGTLVILQGDLTGHFPTVKQTLVVGASSRQVIAGDWNKDGKLDLAVVNNGPSTVQIFRNDGTGLFSLNATLNPGASSGPVAAIAADFNADTRLDLAVADSAADNVAIFLGNTSGGFNAPTTIAPGFGPRGLAAADVNKDGKLDLVVTLGKVSQEGQVALMTGNGTGGFALNNTYFVGPAPNWTTVGDFNRDGNLDLITANNTGANVSVLLSTGAATYLIPGRIPLPTGSFPAAVAVADFNADGKRDIAVANEFLNNISLVSGDGACGFTGVNSANNTGITPITIAAADFNHDNCLDLVTGNNGDGTYSYLQNNNCSANFSVTNGAQVGCLDPIAVAVGDVNGDGSRDFAIVCETSGDLCSRRGTGTGAFGAAVCTPAVTNTAEGLVIGGYNLDAFDDYALTSSPSPPGVPTDVISIAKSDGAGGVLDIPATFPVGLSPRGIVKGDLNGDGFLDLVVANSGSNTISALLGDGGGVFSFPSIDSPAGEAPTALALSDYNLDGKLDVAVVNTNANDVSLLLGDGLGHFTRVGDFGTRDLPVAIAAGDCNGDGKPDLAVADNFNDTVTVLVNTTVSGDPLSLTNFFGQTGSTYTWGAVAGATYDVIRGQLRLVVPGPSSNNLGPVTCLANDLTVTDTANFPDNQNPPAGDSFFYVVRSTVGGINGSYTVSVPLGKPGVPSSGGCP